LAKKIVFFKTFFAKYGQKISGSVKNIAFLSKYNQVSIVLFCCHAKYENEKIYKCINVLSYCLSLLLRDFAGLGETHSPH